MTNAPDTYYTILYNGHVGDLMWRADNIFLCECHFKKEHNRTTISLHEWKQFNVQLKKMPLK
jgi:hypothetical protein